MSDVPTAERENEFVCVSQIVIMWVTESKCVRAKVNDKVESLRSVSLNAYDNEFVLDNVNVLENVLIP